MYQPQVIEKINTLNKDFKVTLDLDKSTFQDLTSKILIDSEFGRCETTVKNLLSTNTISINLALNKNEFFINKSNKIHKNKYTYDKVNYTNNNSKVIINCTKHGDFEQTPSNHIDGRGCYKCGREISAKSQTLTTVEFIEKANVVHNNKYNYSLVNYVNSHEKIVIKCPEHGEFTQNPNSHLRGCGCKDCVFVGVHYNTSNKKSFIDKANLKHNFLYDYSKVNYVSAITKIEIICKKHGSFSQTPNSHLNGGGCNKCGVIKISEHHKENSTGWSYSNWEISSTNSKNFDSFKVYIIKCWDDIETFYKIGKTYRNIKKRFDCFTTLPYSYEILTIIEGDGKTICELEKRLQKLNNEYKYIPKKEFNGMYECFNNIKI